MQYVCQRSKSPAHHVPTRDPVSSVTLTELRYVVAVARERHFGRAAESCFVSQPTLSVAVRKLEEELGVSLFERGRMEIALTEIGERVVDQASRVLEEAAVVKAIAEAGRDQLAGPLRIGAIYTIGPYLLPHLIPQLAALAPRMPLQIEENYTHVLTERLRHGDLDAIIISLPYQQPMVQTWAIYEEPFVVVFPAQHAWRKREHIPGNDLAGENLLLLGDGHCFRDQVLASCPDCLGSESGGGVQRGLEGSSLDTIRHMVASGLGVTVLPATSMISNGSNDMLLVRPFAGQPPSRRVALAWRTSFPRAAAIEALQRAIRACVLPGVRYLDEAEPARLRA